MQVLQNSFASFQTAYSFARTQNPRIPRLSDSDGFYFDHPVHLLHLSGKAGCIISEQTHEIASLFNGGEKGLGAKVVKAAIANGGTWLYCYTHAERLRGFYERQGFKKVHGATDWSLDEVAMTYFALPGHESDIRIKTPDGCAPCSETEFCVEVV